MDDKQEPYENTFSREELRKEVRNQWDTRNELIKALKDLPEVPHWRVLRLLGSAAKFPEDQSIGRQMQRDFGLEAIAPGTEYELGAGLWKRIREGLVQSQSTRHEIRDLGEFVAERKGKE